MKIVIDKHIPFIRGIFDEKYNVSYVSSQNINRECIKDADCLIIRTRTKCDFRLLENTKIKFIASATAGCEHIDMDFCRKNNVSVFIARGCNASSVAQYIGSALSYWISEKKIDITASTIGIVGYGFVGKEVEKITKLLGFKVLVCDPPLQQTGYKYNFVSLDDIAELCDIISFHTPLTISGCYATKGMVNGDFFNKCTRIPLIINAARGGVIDEKTMEKAYKKQKIAGFIIDCWENEPNISEDILTAAILATPHIAGYSLDGKKKATNMCIGAIKDFFNIDLRVEKSTDNTTISRQIRGLELSKLLAQNYNITNDSNKLKSDYKQFEVMRNHYNHRKEIKLL